MPHYRPRQPQNGPQAAISCSPCHLHFAVPFRAFCISPCHFVFAVRHLPLKQKKQKKLVRAPTTLLMMDDNHSCYPCYQNNCPLFAARRLPLKQKKQKKLL